MFQLWENAVYFWSDLQHYRELFYQDGLDPYRVQREAQVSTHIHKIKTNIFLQIFTFLHSFLVHY